MDSLFSVFLLILIALLALWYSKYSKPAVKNRKKLPPGPTGLPIIGNLYQLKSEAYVSLQKMGEKYNSIFSFKLGRTNAVVLNDSNSLKEAFSMISLSGRPRLAANIYRFGDEPAGLIYTDCQTWKEQRDFITKRLRTFDLGNQRIEALAQIEIQNLILNLSQNAGTPVCANSLFGFGIINFLWQIIAGETLGENEKRIIQVLQDRLHEARPSRVTGVGNYLPWFQRFFSFTIKEDDKQRKIILTEIYGFIKQCIKRHQQSQSQPDLINVYLEKILQAPGVNSSFHGKIGEKNLVECMMDLFRAGLDTTSATLVWSLLLLANHTEAQEEMRREIKEVVGPNRKVLLSDRPKMPLTDATIKEILRFSSLVPLGLQHRATEDISFQGYLIPKNTLVIGNLYAVMHDKKVWNNPDKFMPRRFLNADGSLTIRKEAFVPFSVGRRRCIGESLAKGLIFLYLANIFQTFSIQPYSNLSKIPIDCVVSTTRTPKPFRVIFAK